MARTSKTAPLNLEETHRLSSGSGGTIDRLTCPEGKDKVFLRDAEMPGFKVRCTSKGVKSFVFECKVDGKSRSFTIGGVEAWQIADARAEARRLAVLIDQGHDPAALDKAKKQAKAEAAAEVKRAEEFTLGALMIDYANNMERLGRVSHAKVRSEIQLNLLTGAPELAGRPAASVTAAELADMLRAIREAGTDRTAGKLRAYIHAAYELARTADTATSLPVRFKSYGVRHNPAADVAAPPKNTDKNPLKGDDLRQYWQTIKTMDGIKGAALRLHLLTGGQRIEQLCRLQVGNVDNGKSITLHDIKGRPTQSERTEPRPHMVPLIPAATEALNELMVGERAGPWALSVNHGASKLGVKTLATWAAQAGQGLDGFTIKRIRSGVETCLAALRVGQETRGHLLSHGVTGVQAASYDAHDYFDEKREALEKLFTYLEQGATP